MGETQSGSVLLIDDDRSFRFALRKALTRQGFDVLEAASGEEALVLLRGDRPPAAALLDLRMTGMGGLEVLRNRGASPTRIIVLTGHGTVQAAVEAMRLGAHSFLEKPVDAEILKPLLTEALADAGRGATSPDGTPPLIGDSEPMADVRAFVNRVGPTDETVAVYGETGTGKEVVSRHLHLASPRRGGPFIALNAACVPRDLFESELFGHKKGAFTGATSDRLGLFREADGGTLFIDEAAELPSESQAKLLRALESRTVRPVGEAREFPVDVRIVAATNRDLWDEVQAGRFREDLYFRLQVFPVVIAPLRDRREDVVPLAEHLLRRIGSRCALDDGAREILASYDWPGNVRELLNMIRRASLFAQNSVIDEDLCRRMIAASVFALRPRSGDRPSSIPAVPLGRLPMPQDPNVTPSRGVPVATGTVTSLAELEKAHIRQVLEDMGGNVTRTAHALGIDRRTLQRKLKSYGITS